MTTRTAEALAVALRSFDDLGDAIAADEERTPAERDAALRSIAYQRAELSECLRRRSVTAAA